MRILKHILCDEVIKEKKTFSIKNLYDENMVVVDSFPAEKTVAIGVWIGDFPIDRNQFKMVIKKKSGEVIGVGSNFRSYFITKNRTGFITTNFRDIKFLDENTRYIVEYWNFDTLVTTIEIGAVESWMEIYHPIGEMGYALTGI